ncbi:hypothetical protein ScPMuIL_012992 [Solemya velum]
MLRIAGLLVVVAAICVCEGYKNQKLTCKSSPHKPRTCIPRFPSAGTWIKRAKVIKSMCESVPCVLNENYWIERFHIRVSSGCKAEFLVEFEENVIICEHDSATLTCPDGEMIDILSANYGRTEFETCPHPARSDLQCVSGSAVTENVRSCNNRNSCTLAASNGIFGDPCYGTFKYLNVTYDCLVSATKTSVTCEHDTASLSCPAGETIHIVAVNYGRTDGVTCPHTSIKDTNCLSGPAAANIVKTKCNDKNSCYVDVDNGVIGGDPCTLCYPTVTSKMKTFFILVSILFLIKTVYSYTYELIIICEGESKNITCPSGTVIKIVSVGYGRGEPTNPCSNATQRDLCVTPRTVHQITQSTCDGFTECILTASLIFFNDTCHKILQSLNVAYNCVEVVP